LILQVKKSTWNSLRKNPRKKTRKSARNVDGSPRTNRPKPMRAVSATNAKSVISTLVRKSLLRRKYKNKYAKPSKNFRGNPARKEVPNTVAINGKNTVRKLKKKPRNRRKKANC